jgi:predicted  nucleic acid-binding Zn-ribbon protein
MIGKITVENGFIPNSKINKEKINKKAVDVKSTAKDYDSCYAADNTYSETYDDLLESLYAKKNNKQKVITDSEKLDMLLKIVIGLTKRIENTNAKVEEMDKKLKKTEQQTEENTKQLSRIIKLNKLKS